jgi:hypothetical protein
MDNADKQTQAPKEQTQQAPKEQAEKQPPTFRFKLDDTIVLLISCFAEKHMLDDRKTYKSEWKLYYEQHYDAFSREIQRLVCLGYNNKEPIEDKIFKAGRYYFRKKNLHLIRKEKEKEKEKEDEEEEHNKKIRTDKTILASFDKHICQMASTNKIVSPEKGFENYCKTTIEEITGEIMNIYNTHHLAASDISSKLKETYRNRYFNIIRKKTSSVQRQ